MKILVALAVLLCSVNSRAQSGEFKVYPNGLIYSEQTMASLHRIVDSLNILHRACSTRTEYRAMESGWAHYISVEGDGAAIALADMKQGMPYEAFLKKHTLTNRDTGLRPVVRYRSTNYKDEETVAVQALALRNDEYEPSLEWPAKEAVAGTATRRWLFRYYPKEQYRDKASVEAFYLPAGFSAPELNGQYVRAVQYADCLIDTNTTVYLPEAANGVGAFYYPGSDEGGGAGWKGLSRYIGRVTAEPQRGAFSKGKVGDRAFSEAWYAWLKSRFSTLDGWAAIPSDSLHALLAAAVQEELAKPTGNEMLESYAERYGQKTAALRLKRARRPVGQCSQDDRPRQHAVDIAKLAAETVSWEVFLRAHLDVMNDRVARVSDGSYAWGRRQTYLREIEELGVDVPQLIMGISLLLENPSDNHYQGSIPRLGRALAEAQTRPAVEAMLARAVADSDLDVANRVHFFWLFRNYLHYVPKEEKARGWAERRCADATGPGRATGFQRAENRRAGRLATGESCR